MAIQFQPEPGRLLCRAEGELSFEEILDALRGQWSASTEKGLAVLWDLRRAKVDMSAVRVRSLAAFVIEGEREKRPARVALVAGDDLLFGLLRMYESNRSQAGTSVRVFRDYDEADAWTRPEPAQP